MITAVAYLVSWNGNAVRAFALAGLYMCALIAGVVLTAMACAFVGPILAAMVTTVCSACVAFAVAAAPIVAQFVGGMMLIAVLAWVGYPRSK